MPGVTEPTEAMARSGADRLHRCYFKVVVNQARSVIAAVAAAAACSARAASSGGSRRRLQRGATATCCEPGVVSEGPMYAAPSIAIVSPGPVAVPGPVVPSYQSTPGLDLIAVDGTASTPGDAVGPR